MLFVLSSIHSIPLKRRRSANHYLILSSHTDYAQEQEMEIEALEAILMDEFKGFVMPICVFYVFMLFYLNKKAIFIRNLDRWLDFCFCLIEIHSGESGLSTSNRCFQIKVTAQVKCHFLLFM